MDVNHKEATSQVHPSMESPGLLALAQLKGSLEVQKWWGPPHPRGREKIPQWEQKMPIT